MPEAKNATGNSMIPLSVPEIRGNEWEYIKQCLDTNWVSSAGSFVTRFEEEICDYTGSDYAVATVNGTSALHVALLVSDIEEHDEVILPPLTFIAPANATRYLGAHPIFLDVESDHGQLDPLVVRRFLREQCETRGGELTNKATGRRVKGLMPVHVLGHAVDLDPLMELADEYDLTVIEDASESLGVEYRGQHAGTYGDFGCLSFNGNKIITTGGGGMLLTDDENLAEKARYLTTQAKDDPVEYVHGEVGYNYRLTNIQAAMGCAQLEQIDDYVRKKKAIARRYDEAFESIHGIEPIAEPAGVNSTFWMYTVLIDSTEFGCTSREVMSRLDERNIQTRPLWQPLYRNPPYVDSFVRNCERAETIHERALSLPCSVGLEETKQARVIENIERIHRDRH